MVVCVGLGFGSSGKPVETSFVLAFRDELAECRHTISGSGQTGVCNQHSGG
jgi:hypothetical protein